jgi:hypothetical protein
LRRAIDPLDGNLKGRAEMNNKIAVRPSSRMSVPASQSPMRSRATGMAIRDSRAE